MTHWLIDGNNVFGSRPDGWWNDRAGAMRRFTQCVGEWCRQHQHPVWLVFDPPVPDDVIGLGGFNLRVVAAQRHGADAADDTICALARRLTAHCDEDQVVVVVTSDRGLRGRLPEGCQVWGTGRFRSEIRY